MRVLVLTGPTGSGKSSLVAELFHSPEFVIINTDSQQVYHDLPIGTSQPTSQEKSSAEHRLYGFAESGTRISAGKFTALVDNEIKALHSAGKTPVLVGGSGLYIKSIINGLDDLPSADQKIRERLQNEIGEKGVGFLYQRLEKFDPSYASVISRNDKVRIIRALEIFELSGLKLGELRKEVKPPKYNAVIIGLDMPRHILYERINRRTELMLASGWIEETKIVIGKGLRDWLYGLPAIGYNHIIDNLEGRIDKARRTVSIQTDTRHYAKRQMTWFRKMKGVQWVDYDGKGMPEKLKELIRQ